MYIIHSWSWSILGSIVGVYSTIRDSFQKLYSTNNNSNKTKTMFMVLHHDSESLREFTRFTQWMQNNSRRPLDQAEWPIDLAIDSRWLWNYIHRRHLLLFSPKAGTLFTIPRRVEGWVDLDGWLHTQTVYTCPRAVTYPSGNRAQCWLTTLVEANALTTTLHRHC